MTVCECAVSSEGGWELAKTNPCAVSYIGGAVNSVYDYLNLAARSLQGCINKGERVNKLEVSECFESFNAFRDLSQTPSPQTLATLCVFLPFFVFPVRSSVPQRIKAVIKQRGITRRQAREVVHHK